MGWLKPHLVRPMIYRIFFGKRKYLYLCVFDEVLLVLLYLCCCCCCCCCYFVLGVQKVPSSVEEASVQLSEDVGVGVVPVRSSEVSANVYACSAVDGFFRSIALSVENSLQDTLR